LEALRAIADEHDLKLIEDCAHALGATYKSRPIGAWGDSAIFSFQAIKHMTTIDGGILTLKDERLIDEAKQRRWFGLRKGIERSQSNITLQGFKYNMTNVAAVIGLAQLDDISTKIQKHIMHGKFLDALVARTEGVSSARIVDGAQPSYWIYTLLAHSESKADTLINTFNAHKIGASKLHKPNHQHSIFASPLTNLPNTDDFFARLVHVPCGWWLNKQSLKLISSVLTNSQDND
jgi:dTDP-4-amino-4,6-dideoxygalactose transaminase